MFIDIYSWWNRTAEQAKQESAEVIDRVLKAARLGFPITPDPISTAHVTGTALKIDSGMLTQNEACLESWFPELKRCVFFYQAVDCSDTVSIASSIHCIKALTKKVYIKYILSKLIEFKYICQVYFM